MFTAKALINQAKSGNGQEPMFRRPASKRNAHLIATGLLLALGVTPIALRPTAVRADEQGGFQGTLTVQFTGSQQCASGDSVCSRCVQANSLFVEAQGIAQTTLGPLFAKVLKCANPNAAPNAPYGTYAGTMTLSLTPPVTPPSVIAPPKDVLTLTYTGLNDDGSDFYGFGPFSGKLVVQSGTGKFQGAQGTLTFIASGGPSLAGAEFGATVSPFSVTGNAFYLFQGTIQRVSQ
jgi:hypothetical protein